MSAQLTEHEIVLRDGSVAVVRPIRPEDKDRLQRGLQQLSPRSRFLRFHTAMDELSDSQLRYLTEIDYTNHMAWVALDPAQPEEPGMGVARYVRLADEPTVAEAAVTVVDRYQGRGLGTALLKLIVGSALANGITTLRNYVLASNTAMLDIFNELGATRIPEGGGVYRIDLPLTPVVETSAPAEMLRQAALAPAAAEDAPSVGFTALRHWWERRDDADA